MGQSDYEVDLDLFPQMKLFFVSMANAFEIKLEMDFLVDLDLVGFFYSRKMVNDK